MKAYLTYRGTVTEIAIHSTETDDAHKDDAWFAAFADSSNPDAFAFFNCIAGHIDLDIFMHYGECAATYTGASRYEKEFPVLYKDGDGLHPAVMTIIMTSA